MKDFLFFFLIQFFSYGIFCWNARAISFGWYGNLIASDAVYGLLQYTVIKKVAESKSRAGLVGYTLGGIAGSVLSVWITKHYLG